MPLRMSSIIFWLVFSNRMYSLKIQACRSKTVVWHVDRLDRRGMLDLLLDGLGKMHKDWAKGCNALCYIFRSMAHNKGQAQADKSGMRNVTRDLSSFCDWWHCKMKTTSPTVCLFVCIHHAHSNQESWTQREKQVGFTAWWLRGSREAVTLLSPTTTDSMPTQEAVNFQTLCF